MINNERYMMNTGRYIKDSDHSEKKRLTTSHEIRKKHIKHKTKRMRYDIININISFDNDIG